MSWTRRSDHSDRTHRLIIAVAIAEAALETAVPIDIRRRVLLQKLVTEPDLLIRWPIMRPGGTR